MAIDVQLWRDRIRDCVDLQSTHTPMRNEIITMFAGGFFGKKGAAAFSELNFLYEYVKVKRSTIFSRNPHIFARARNKQYTEFAETMETVLNYYWRELKIKQKYKDIIDEAILVPPGWIEIGFTGQLITSTAQPFTDETKPSKVESQLGFLDETIKDADVFARYVPYTDVIWPDGYNNIREAPYIIKIERLRLAEVINNPLYNKNKHLIKGTFSRSVRRLPKLKTFSSQVPLTRDAAQNEDKTEIVLYHIWDKRDRQRFTIPHDNDFTIYEKPWDTLTEGFTLYPLFFTRIPPTETNANSYPLSDAMPMMPQLRDLHLINDAILRHGKRHGTLIIARKGVYTDDEKDLIQRAGDVALIELESLSKENLDYFNTPALPPDWYRIRELLLQDLFRITGYQQLLGSQRGIETATESENAKAGELLRTSDAVDTMEDHAVDVARGLSGLIWQYVPRDRIAQIVGEELTENMWPTLPDSTDEARHIIQREIHFRIDAGSMQPPKNEAVERKQWIDTVATIKELFPNVLNDDIIVAQLLKKLEFKDIEQAVRGNTDIEIQVAQRENQLLLQGNEIPVSPNENHMVHLQVHAQAQQVPGLQPTPAYDQHVLSHAQFLQASGGGNDKLTTPNTANTKRRGVPDFVDLSGGATNTARGTGTNTAR